MENEKARLAWALEAGHNGGAYGGRLFDAAMSLETARPRGRFLLRVLAQYSARSSLDFAIRSNNPTKSQACRPAEREMPEEVWRNLCVAYMAHHWRSLRPDDVEPVRQAMDRWAGVPAPDNDDGNGDPGALEARLDDPGARRMGG